MENKAKKKIVLGAWAVVAAAVIGATAYGNYYATTWDRALSGYFGEIGGAPKQVSENLAAEQKALELEIVDEGGVLLQNDNDALPLKKGANVSVFGMSNQMWMTKEKIGGKDTVFLESLQSAGLNINTELRKFYKRSTHAKWGAGSNLGNGAVQGNWKIDEVPQSEYTQTVKDSYKNFSDAAIVVLSRGGGEGGDLPRYMGLHGGDDDTGYLELTQNEKDLLQAVKDAGVFKKTVLVLHTCNAMQMDFMKDNPYGIDAVLWISGTGADGVQEMGKYFTGEVNPSGHNVDTYVYDNYSAPAMQNFGDYRFTENGNPIEATTTNVGGTYSYLNYGEGIYVGYRYYETRYEDFVMKRDKVGNYDYASTVYQPFGHGLSYSEFEWSDFKMKEVDWGKKVELSVKVTNRGELAGKEVVGFYAQAPYTAGGIEKSAVSLLDFGKTKLLEKGESETVSVTVDYEAIASYDAEKTQGYVLDAGTYYFTAAPDAHAAINNILSEKGYSVSNGMTENGDTSMVESASLERKEYKEAATGAEISNLFDDLTLPDAKYLSREDWSVLETFDKATLSGGVAYTDGALALGTNTAQKANSVTMDNQGTVGVHAASPAILKGLKAEGWDASGNPVPMNDSSWSAVSYSSKTTSYTLKDMVGLDYKDEKWDELTNQMTQKEQTYIVGLSGWGTGAVESVGKPDTKYMDGPQGMINYVDPSNPGYQFTDQNVLGATWNKELAAREGDLVSQEFIQKGATAWWAPGLNIHRTAYSGRNFEYFSEDPAHCAKMGVAEMTAAQENGVATMLKHFFLNDQETNRNANGKLAQFATEQSMREIYAVPFRACVEEGKSFGVMASMARFGTTAAPCSYAALTALLRNEWGFQGAVITDSQSFYEAEAEQALAAGCDMVLTTQQTKYAESTLSSAGGQYALHQAAKNILYFTTNTAAVHIGNVGGFAIYKLLLIALDLIVLIYLAYGTVEILIRLNPEQSVISKKGKWVMRGVLWGVAAILVVALAVVFFSTWLPLIMDALQNY